MRMKTFLLAITDEVEPIIWSEMKEACPVNQKPIVDVSHFKNVRQEKTH